MNIRMSSLLTTVVASCLFAHLATAETMMKSSEPYAWKVIPAGERRSVGAERGTPLMVKGGTNLISVPVTIATQVRDEARNYGALGVVSGTVRGGFKAATQAIEGVAHATIGFLDVLTAPIGGLD